MVIKTYGLVMIRHLNTPTTKTESEASEVAYQTLPVGLGIPEVGGIQQPEVPTEITAVTPTIVDYSTSCDNTITKHNCIFSVSTSCNTIPVATSSAGATSVVSTNNSSSSSSSSKYQGTIFSHVNVPTSDTITTDSLTTTGCFSIFENKEFDKTNFGNLVTSPVNTKHELFTGGSSVTTPSAISRNSDCDLLHRWSDISPRGPNFNFQNTQGVDINRYITTTTANNNNNNNIAIDDTNIITQTTADVVGGHQQADSALLASANIGTSLGFATPTSYTTDKNHYVDILDGASSSGSSTSDSTTLFDSTTTPNKYRLNGDHFFPDLGFNNQRQQTNKLSSTFFDLVDVDLQEEYSTKVSVPGPLLSTLPSPHHILPHSGKKSCATTFPYSKPQRCDELQVQGVRYLAHQPPLPYRAESLIQHAGLHATTVTNPNCPVNQYNNYSQSQPDDPCSSPNADGNTTIARRTTATTAPIPSGTINTNKCHEKYSQKRSSTRAGGSLCIENKVRRNNNSDNININSDSCSGACCSGSSNSCCCSSSESSPDNDITISRNRRKKKSRCRVGGSVSSPIVRRSRLEEDRSERNRHKKNGRIDGGREGGSSVLTVGAKGGGAADNKDSLPKTHASFGSSLASSGSSNSAIGFHIKDSVNSNNNNNNNRTPVISGIAAVDGQSLCSGSTSSTNSRNLEREAVDDYFYKHCRHSSPQHRRQRNVLKFAASSDDNDVEDDNGDERELLKRRRRRRRQEEEEEEEENGFNEEEEEEEEEVENPEQQLLISECRVNKPPKKADSHYNRWWGNRKNRRWWPIVAGGRGFTKKTKKQDLQEEEEEEEEFQDLELLKNSRPEDPSTGGGGRLGGVTPYTTTTTTTTSSSVIVAGDDDDPRYSFRRHLYYKRITTGEELESQQQQQECHRHGYYHHQQQQQSHHHHCRYQHPQGSNKTCHHQQQQYHSKSDGDGVPPDIQNTNNHQAPYRHHHHHRRRHHYHRHHNKDHYCRFNTHGGGGGAYDEDGGGEEDEEEEGEEQRRRRRRRACKSGGRARGRFRRGQGEAATAMESCTQCLKNEFKPENAGLNYDDPSVFVRSQWPLDHRLYVLYRIVVALGFIAWIIADIIDEAEKFYKDRFWIWFIFATNWSFILLTLTTIFEAICSTYYMVAARGLVDKFRYHKENSDQQYFQEMPICLKIQWLLYNLGANTAIVITISYWSFIFFMEHSNFLMTNMSKTKHMLNTVYVVLDIFISATPIRIFHMLFPIMLGSIYAIFNATYFLNDGTILDGRHYAYNVLNWNVPAEAIVTCILCIAQTIFSQIILYHLAALRKWIASKIYKPREIIPEHDSEMLSIMSADSTTYLATDSQNETGPGSIH